MGQIIRLIDSNTKESVNYEEVTIWHDGTPMDDTKVDNVIYRKKGSSYYVNTKFISKRSINVTDFGIFPGTNEDLSTKVNNLLDLAQRLNITEVFFPEGIYHLNSYTPVGTDDHYNYQLKIKGEGKSKTIFKGYVTTLDVFTVRNTNVLISGIRFSEGLNGLTIGNTIGNPGSGISRLTINDIECMNNKDSGMLINSIVGLTVKDSSFSYNNNRGIYSGVGSIITAAVFDSCSVRWNGKGPDGAETWDGHGLHLRAGKTIQFNSCWFESNYKYGTLFSPAGSALSNIIFNTCWWEANNVQGRNNNDAYSICLDGAPTGYIGFTRNVVFNSCFIPNARKGKAVSFTRCKDIVFNNCGIAFVEKKEYIAGTPYDLYQCVKDSVSEKTYLSLIDGNLDDFSNTASWYFVEDNINLDTKTDYISVLEKLLYVNSWTGLVGNIQINNHLYARKEDYKRNPKLKLSYMYDDIDYTNRPKFGEPYNLLDFEASGKITSTDRNTNAAVHKLTKPITITLPSGQQCPEGIKVVVNKRGADDNTITFSADDDTVESCTLTTKGHFVEYILRKDVLGVGAHKWSVLLTNT